MLEEVCARVHHMEGRQSQCTHGCFRPTARSGYVWHLRNSWFGCRGKSCVHLWPQKSATTDSKEPRLNRPCSAECGKCPCNPTGGIFSVTEKWRAKEEEQPTTAARFWMCGLVPATLTAVENGEFNPSVFGATTWKLDICCPDGSVGKCTQMVRDCDVWYGAFLV